MNGIIDIKIDTDNGNISPDLIVGDIVISKAATGRDTHTYRAVVNKVTSDTITLVTTTLIDCDKAKLWVRVGNVNDADRQAYIVMDSEGSDAPKIAMYDNVDDVDKVGSIETLKLVIGNLDGISVPEFAAMQGYGLYAENVYLKGDMILGDNSSISFNSVTDGVSNVTTITKNTVTTEYINTLNITALGAVVAGTFSLGNGKFEVDNNGILTAEDGNFNGSITGSNITGSVIQGGTFRTSATNARVQIAESTNDIKIYNSSNQLSIQLDDTLIQVGPTEFVAGMRIDNGAIHLSADTSFYTLMQPGLINIGSALLETTISNSAVTTNNIQTEYIKSDTYVTDIGGTSYAGITGSFEVIDGATSVNKVLTIKNGLVTDIIS